jgi:adenosylcobinamide kinase/adenosylcobinamide-phosphate guanylyltransferase
VEADSGLTLILGPSGGGKSRWAEHLAAVDGRPVVYLATGPTLPDDADWQTKLDRHRRRRPGHWTCLEVGGELAAALDGLPDEALVLVDSLGTWVATWLNDDPSTWLARSEALFRSLNARQGPLLLVAEEVGWSVVPATASGALFRQRLTELLQLLQPQAARTWLVVADRAIDLHQLGLAVPQDPIVHLADSQERRC